MMTFLNTEAWKHGGLYGFIIFSFVAAVTAIWKYFTLSNEAIRKYFLDEKKRYEDQIKVDALRIKELQEQILKIKQENIDRLEQANMRLKETNRLLEDQLRKNI